MTHNNPTQLLILHVQLPNGQAMPLRIECQIAAGQTLNVNIHAGESPATKDVTPHGGPAYPSRWQRLFNRRPHYGLATSIAGSWSHGFSQSARRSWWSRLFHRRPRAGDGNYGISHSRGLAGTPTSSAGLGHGGGLRRRFERGSSPVITFLGLILPMFLLLDLISALVIARPAQISVAAAARNCVRMAVASLNGVLGPQQGETVGLETLTSAGLAGRDPHVNVTGEEGWDRGGNVSCTAQVTVPFGALGLVARLVGRQSLQIRETQSLSIEQWKSRWTGGN